MQNNLSASSGNRTRAARVAGEHSTTEPTMLGWPLLTSPADLYALVAVVAEWLRRLTRNQFPSGSVGSNPTNCEHRLLVIFTQKYCFINLHKSHPPIHQFLDSLVVRISACHVEGPGSIPGRGENLFCVTTTNNIVVQKMLLQVRLELTTPA